jgi:hypothetical protein
MLLKALRYRARFRLSMDGMAIEETQGAYVSVEEHEAYVNEVMSEAQRLLRMATARYPLALTAVPRRAPLADKAHVKPVSPLRLGTTSA